LRQYGQTSESTADLLTGNARASIARGGATLQNSEAEREFVRALHSSGQFGKLASFWVSGSDIDWEELRHGDGARRISLPTYPFARDRYWVPETVTPTVPLEAIGHSRIARLHPLIDANISTLSEIRFKKDLAADDDYLRDHLVRGQPVLPGAAQLEMARAAAELARGLPVAALANIVWMRPVVVIEGSITVFTSLSYHREKLQFEIWTEAAGKKLVHSQGKIEFEPSSQSPAAHEPIPLVANGRLTTVGRAEIYRDFALAGLAYGERFRVIDEISANVTEARASLQLPAAWGTSGQTGWHPALVDGAFQTIAGLAGSPDESRIHLPFSIGRIESRRPLGTKCQAVVRVSKSSTGSSGVRKFDIFLADPSGLVLMEMSECSFREVPTQRQPVAAVDSVRREDPALAGLLLQLERGEISWEEADQRTRLVGPENGASR
jgi:acyl transferase domain-containing protein